MKIPDKYRFTEKDVDRAMDTQFNYFENDGAPKPSDEEWELSELALTAYNIFVDKRRWPTVAEVREHRQRKADEAEKRYVNTFTEEAQKKYWEEKKRQQDATQ